MKRFPLAFAAMSSLLLTSVASAHFIFAVAEPAERSEVVKIYLSELAAPDDPSFLPQIEKAKAWVVGNRGKLEPVELKIEGDALAARLPERAGGAFVLNHTFGVMSRGAEPFLIKYYAKAYTNTLPGNWSEVDKVEELPLEIVPEVKANEVVFKVLWQGKPAAGSQVTVEGPGLEEALQGDANDKGEFVAKLDKAGLYSVRARLMEQTEGEHEGKPYKAVRHYSTLAMPFTPPQVIVAEPKWPDLQKGMTSFGAVVVGDSLYTYGGNYGGGHEYSEAEQSGDFIRLSLKDGKDWEALPGGPKLTGLAMVAHNGKIYRVGGFIVTDETDGKAKLNSQNSFARFDTEKGAWEDLAPLPEPRSSHDVAVIGDQLYVVGGWSMNAASGSNDDGWLKTIYSIDLSAEKPEWKALTEAPFERRAISAAGHDGKLYVIGGMQAKGGTTTRVDIFDPSAGTWSEGPSLLGNGMDGFGTAAVDVDGELVVTTMSGSIQALSADGSHWEYQGQLQSPRFFHESPAWDHGVVVVGGASMMTGKAESLEFLPTGNAETAQGAAAAE